MAKPLVAVVGRPNVGKSTFFNVMARQRISIVEDEPGVTRDRIYTDVEWVGVPFTLVDTGGLDPKSEDVLLSQMRRQAEIAVDTADVILFFVDARDGMTSLDHDVADYLRKTQKPVLLVVNKADSDKLEEDAIEFYELGIGEPIPISSANLFGLGDLLDRVVALFPDTSQEEQADENKPIQIAVVGRPNVGKSSLITRLLGQDRVMVSDIPGTTRDAVDTPLTIDGQDYMLIDTAGIRRKARIEHNSLERYSVVRSLGAIRRCDVALILIDAQTGVTEQDTKIAGLVHEAGKASVVVVNKWDAVEKETGTLEKKRAEVLSDLKFMDYAPVLFVSALTGQRVHKLMEMVNQVHEQATRRISTGVLNEVLHDSMSVNPPPSDKGRRLKIFYATQATVQPPSFVLFVNDAELMHFSYERYLENQFRKAFELTGTPVRLFIRTRKKEDAK